MDTLAQPADTLAAACTRYAWCALDEDPRETHDFHYSHGEWTGPFQHGIEVRQDGSAAVTLGTGYTPEYLDPQETDALIKALKSRRRQVKRLARATDRCAACGRPVSATEPARITVGWLGRRTATHWQCQNGGAR